VASAGIRQERLLVIDRYLFSIVNVTQGKEKHVAIDGLHESIWVATVIYVVRAIPTARSVEAPFAVDVTDTEMPTAAGALHRFPVRDSLTGVFSNFLSLHESPGRETTLAIDPRSLDFQTGRQLHWVLIC
jgi:hypothetical protein